MPRPQRELDPEGGELVAFARELRALRVAAGTPKFATMERRTGRSKSTLAEAAGGRHLPRWETVADFVLACEADPAPWRDRWSEVRRAVLVGDAAAQPTRDAPTAPDAELPTPEPPDVEPPDTPAAERPVDQPPDPVSSGSAPAAVSPPPRRSRATVVAAACTGIALAAAGGFLVGRATVPDLDPVTIRAIEVQNKVALGPSSLVEDRTPAYLSSLPIAYCGATDRNCKVPGTEMGSGAGIVATCVVHGQQMWNYNLAEASARENPDRVGSDLWYRAAFPDGRAGYLSEVYLTVSSRGGLGLPQCDPTRAPAG